MHIISLKEISVHFWKKRRKVHAVRAQHTINEWRLARILEISRCRPCTYSASLNTCRWVDVIWKQTKTGSMHCACPCITQRRGTRGLVILDAILDINSTCKFSIHGILKHRRGLYCHAWWADEIALQDWWILGRHLKLLSIMQRSLTHSWNVGFHVLEALRWQTLVGLPLTSWRLSTQAILILNQQWNRDHCLLYNTPCYPFYLERSW